MSRILLIIIIWSFIIRNDCFYSFECIILLDVEGLPVQIRISIVQKNSSEFFAMSSLEML